MKKQGSGNGRVELSYEKNRWDRRTFLKALGALGIGAAGALAVPKVFDVTRLRGGLEKVTVTRLRMGTYVTITTATDSKQIGEEAIGRAFEEIDRLIAILSGYDSGTPLDVLNREGAVTHAPAELIEVLAGAGEFYRTTNGTFDVTIKPVVDLFAATAGQNGVAPQRSEIDDAMALVGFDGIEMAPRHIRTSRAGMAVTLDGIAKGYIVDRAAKILDRCGVENYLIDGGGDMRARGTRDNGSPWRIAVEDPDGGDYPAVICLGDAAVATSGNYEIYFDREKLLHHIVDPRTGMSPAHSAGVTVVAPSAARADALSTATFVMSPAQGLGLIDSLPATECLILASNEMVYRSRGWGALEARRA